MGGTGLCDYCFIMNRTILRPVFAGASGPGLLVHPESHTRLATRRPALHSGLLKSNDALEGMVFLALSVIGLAALVCCLASSLVALSASNSLTL